MTANDSKSYLPYLNKLMNQYNKTYHHSINKIFKWRKNNRKFLRKRFAVE